MASLQVYSSFPYGDSTSLREFFVENALRHTQYASLIGARLSQQMPLFDVFDSKMVHDVIQMIRRPRSQWIDPESFRQWLQMHSALHAAEIKALGLGQTFDLYDADFSEAASMQDWLNYHASIHDYTDAALGV